MCPIVWMDEAFDEMSRIVLLHPRRRAEIAAALKSLSNRLARDPLAASESRAGDVRVVIADPLAVYFRMVEDAGGPAVEVGWVVIKR